METIRKKICFDKSLSHRNGLVPFFEKNSENGDIVYVTGGNSDGNYGNFACDFVLISATTVTDANTGIECINKEEISRMKYLDIIRKYNALKKILKNSVIVKKARYIKSNTLYEDCINSANTITSEEEVVKWTVNFTDGISLYDFIDMNNSANIILNPNIPNNNLLNIDYFTIIKEGEYELSSGNIDTRDRVQELLDNEEEVTDEDLKVYEYVNHVESIQEDDSIEYCILIGFYDFVINCDEEWESWWQECFDLSTYNSYYHHWEQYIFEQNYIKPCNLKFFNDVEKYILGRIVVPETFENEKIEGIRVPEVVTVLNYMDYKLWFDTNEELIYVDKDIKKEWEERGGNVFHDFLNSIVPFFMPHLIEPTHGNEIYFTYAVPNIEVSMLLENDYIIENEYVPYEYSIDINGDIIDGTSSYTAPSNGIGSMLTPQFCNFEDGEVICESKLNNLRSENCFVLSDEIYGVFNEFQHGSQLFKCTYRTGSSVTSKVIRYKNIDTYNYKIVNGEMALESITSSGYHYDGVEVEEVKPSIVSNCYQVVGIEVIDTQFEDELMDDTAPGFPFLTEEYFYYNDTDIILSAYTYQYYESAYDYSWWECTKLNYSLWDMYDVADGEIVTNPQELKYKNVLILSCLPYIVNDETDGNWYFFMARYDNGNTNRSAGQPIDFECTIKALDIPYTVGEPMNIMSYDGEWSGTTIYDIIESETIDEENGTIEVQYVIGKTSGASSDTGIKYKEVFSYSGNCHENAIIDGIYEAEIYYNKLFIINNTVAISEEYEAQRSVNVANITGMEIGTQWTSASCVNAPLITEESSDGLIDTPNISVSLSFDRGSGAAWERHFKLSECNTLEDLENYGNGTFFNT